MFLETRMQNKDVRGWESKELFDTNVLEKEVAKRLIRVVFDFQHHLCL
jgi:hypothetical protein